MKTCRTPFLFAFGMRALSEIEENIETGTHDLSLDVAARELLTLGEEVLEHWLVAKGLVPTRGKVEGFRLLALHRQGAKGDPSFNACRETCRELVYHYNLLTLEADHSDVLRRRLSLMRMVVSHLYFFVSGKMQTAELGEFCCSSRSLRIDDDIG
jgi:hypothetical protein